MRFDEGREISLTCDQERGQISVRVIGTATDGDTLLIEARGEDLEDALRNLADRIAEQHEVY